MKSFPLRALVLLLAIALLGCGGGGAGTSPPPNPPPSGDGGEDPTAPQPLRVLVRIEDDDDDDDPPVDIADVAREAGAVLLGPIEGTSWWILEVPAGTSPSEVRARLDNDVRVLGSDDDDDVFSPEGGEGGGATLPLGGDFFDDEVAQQTSLGRIGLPAAHARTRGAGVRVAVIDSGVIPFHPLLAGRIEPAGYDFVGSDPEPWEEANGRDDDRDGRVDEGYGHGTFVASLVLAVAPEATIVPYRVLNDDSFGRASDIALAIAFAVGEGVDVINLSVGLTADVDVIEDVVRSARLRDVAVVVSAGNTGREELTFPASTPDAISVTAVDDADRRAPFASYGDDVDLSAPGVALLGAYPTSRGATRWSGTSFAAAVVTGGFALVRALDPFATVDDIEARLRDTAADVDATNPDLSGELGKGRIDLEAATAP